VENGNLKEFAGFPRWVEECNFIDEVNLEILFNGCDEASATNDFNLLVALCEAKGQNICAC
jgi:hypothetical protein